MSPRNTFATAHRVLLQIKHDPRTIAMLVVVPCVLLVLLRYVFDDEPQIFQQIGAPLCGLFPFIIMFLISSITMLRERTTGTLERLMTLPIAKLDLLLGYGIAFGALAIAQAIAVCITGFPILGLNAPHGVLLITGLAILNAILGMALGLCVSAFAKTEFQAVQFMPALIFPQLLLCGLFVARDQMAPLLEAISDILPLTYAYEALALATAPGDLDSDIVVDALVVAGFTIGALVLGAWTLRRRTA